MTGKPNIEIGAEKMWACQCGSAYNVQGELLGSIAQEGIFR
jgi:hypothetical protein